MKTLLLLIALSGQADFAVAEALRVFLAPAGDDSRDGLAPDQSIKSLARAHDIIAQALGREPRDAEVRIAPGTYSGQSVKWKFSMPGQTITFLPTGNEADRPIFDGGGKGTWFTFGGHADGALTGLIFRYLRVQNYQTAITFNGNRMKAESSSRGNTIDGCYFFQVGEGSTAAIRLVNSSGNRIVNSDFMSIVSRSGPGLLHAIYAAHGSAENLILLNRFQNCCGDPVRFRDGSGNNTVEANRFVRSGIKAAVTDWFCDHDLERNCTKPTAECPSWSNTAKDNVLDNNFAGRQLEATYAFSERIPSGCARPYAEARRFIVSGNRKP